MKDTPLLSTPPKQKHSLLHKIDGNDLLTAIIVILIWIGLSFISPQTLYVPYNDSLSSYPYIDDDLISPIIYSIIIFPGSWLFISIFYIISKFLNFGQQDTFRKFHFWTAIWIHLISVVLTVDVIAFLNIFVGRVRPNFYARCGKITDPNECDVLSKYQFDNERKSFPASDPGAIMASMLFLTLLLQKMCLRRPSWVSCLSMIFVAFAFIAGSTCIREYKNHADDVVAGFAIGAIICSTLFYGSHKRIFRHLKEEPSDVSSG
ncbi:PAP2 superfamily protein [Tritrichomonas foetus]|uniref:PAP2 superfamily protein n=1 Tax=Tritrichomonas foetus TaxID=1144522 RepID=A0A1J4L6F4_9EUKA|nr:PAP2 superfamily protein [Tritrichomonas foetus]|eukprot:OHT17525.1 PAP2 superfamily protein [Tritrichomonas foetus]